jgi:hypothetical protein
MAILFAVISAAKPSCSEPTLSLCEEGWEGRRKGCRIRRAIDRPGWKGWCEGTCQGGETSRKENRNHVTSGAKARAPRGLQVVGTGREVERRVEKKWAGKIVLEAQQRGQQQRGGGSGWRGSGGRNERGSGRERWAKRRRLGLPRHSRARRPSQGECNRANERDEEKTKRWCRRSPEQKVQGRKSWYASAVAVVVPAASR